MSAVFLILFLSCGLLTPLLTFACEALPTAAARLAVFSAAALLGGICLHAWARRRAQPGWRFPRCLAAAVLLGAFLHIAASYGEEVSTYPLTMGWSETSRFYYASLFFAERIYGQAAAPTVLHPSRYLLQSIPFLLPDTPLWLHRLWQAGLWVALPTLAALALARRTLPKHPAAVRWLLAAAAYGYLMIGPVYYHLLVPVILMLWGFKPERRPLASAVCLLIAGAWAGISRVNWYPVPGLLAAALIVLEQPLPLQMTGAAWRLSDLIAGPERLRLWRYLLPLAGWALIGTAAAFLAQIAYIAWSGNAAEQFTSSFTSDLLWSRLLPNPTYPPGILLGVMLVSLPAGLILAGRLIMDRLAVHPLRLFTLAVMLLALLAGGLVVSVKIGGGSNLHNLDAYLVLLLVVATYFVTERVAPDAADSRAAATGRLDPAADKPGTAAAVISRSDPDAGRNPLVAAGVALALAAIVVFGVGPRGAAEARPERQAAEAGAQTIIEAAEATAERGGQVLFLSNRHLLTFGDVKNVVLVPDYERVFLMEAAMSGDPAYLGRFYTDLENRRFALIVSEPLSRQQKGAEDVFGAENDAWVKRVAGVILCYYEPVKTLRAVQVQLLAPRATPEANCR